MYTFSSSYSLAECRGLNFHSPPPQFPCLSIHWMREKRKLLFIKWNSPSLGVRPIFSLPLIRKVIFSTLFISLANISLQIPHITRCFFKYQPQHPDLALTTLRLYAVKGNKSLSIRLIFERFKINSINWNNSTDFKTRMFRDFS